jgi:UDP-N-acetylglucosamine diphosphorylase / glucose-1-phosphate thymidylyltransferase / UDP-N-acetylgalactosamine diphosphorylase / glucosamine-1-phosphate N-acetyltransferase / galactosamine-1-phosphate N-acetyltransferase
MDMSVVKSWELFDLNQTLAAELLRQVDWPWEALTGIGKFILRTGLQLPDAEYEQIAESIWVARDCEIAGSACLNGPLIIGHEAEIRHCAYIRGNVLVGEGTIVGNSTELKNSILCNAVQVPHYNYVGDSILGYKAHMGAGSITSNIKGDRSLVSLRLGDERIPTGLRKFGALLGDFTEIGCNAVLNPGTIIGRNSQVYPLAMVRGYVPADRIVKQDGEIIARLGPYTPA